MGEALGASCQMVQSPAGSGRRLVAESSGAVTPIGTVHADAEIRLTYRELSALIEEAIRSLR